MINELKKEGKYELFTTPTRKEVINFDDMAYYSLSQEKDEKYIASQILTLIIQFKNNPELLFHRSRN